MATTYDLAELLRTAKDMGPTARLTLERVLVEATKKRAKAASEAPQ